ncbi:hypothetical protein DAPPUDRAFT_312311 [Daphnia pulex]|uniref:Peptidase C1A papain C-terminal domain-containing protein n=1 Tax=Daphnia pulex TaxID=6669 RepID=E9G0F1_DAPPU|nr:hypothetical protein DAPPUDRAFT_312311 [Daphnia pulex]|eukprot:EFX86894.1 hypothetical protein DAPPUDRAFT_312311 [Daphnia pulex]
MKFLAAILLFTSAVAAATKDEDAWISYKAKFGKRYSAMEEGTRKQNFLTKLRVIEKNNLENKKWQMGQTKFTDLTNTEKNLYRGAKMAKRVPVRTINPEETTSYSNLERALPASIDYRSNKCLQPVKDQGPCSSCWSFAAITPLEFNQCKKTGVAVSLSEQMSVDCDNYNYACTGGDFTLAWQYMEERGGAMKTSVYPYVSGTTKTNGTCKFSSSGVGAQVSFYDWTIPYPNATVSMTYLQNSGPLPTAMKVLDSFFHYTSGVYSDPACILADEYDINHAVVIIGYGTTVATSTVPATPYWIVRNSWGTGWGYNGYFYIQRGVNMCNIESWTAYVKNL